MKRFFEKITNWELWPFNVFYFPLGFVWAWYCLRARSVWFFSSSNPTLTFGGFEGEGKKEMYEQLPPDSYPTTVFIEPDEPFEAVLEKLTTAGLRYPFIVKPDVGMKGYLFRKIDSEQQMRRYHEANPVTYMAQGLADYPMELSVFYFRHPATQKGTVSGMTYKELLEVYGDGHSTLLALIQADPRASLRVEELQQRHAKHLDEIIPKGELFILSYAANRNRGARLHNLRHLIDEELCALFDRFSLYNGQFFYGRYDIKCRSVEDMKKGEHYKILEFNGAGAAPNHVYHCGLTLFQAYREILRHWKALYTISAYNNAHGTPYWPLIKGWRYLRTARKHFKMMAEYEKKIAYD